MSSVWRLGFGDSKEFARVLAIAASLAALAPCAIAQQVSVKPGVTVYGFDIEERQEGMPTLVPGQTPNVSFDAKNIDFHGPIGTLATDFYGEIHGFLEIAENGKRELRLVASGGAELRIDDKLAIDAEESLGKPRDAIVDLTAGRHPFLLRFYHGGGTPELVLSSRAIGGGEFAVLDGSVLKEEDGLTHVVAPGKKRYSRKGAMADFPGDGRPLEGVHPGYSLETIRPSGFEPKVGALAFLPDGRLVICTWDETGSVYLMDHLDDEKQRSLHRFANGLGEPLGCAIVDGVIYVSQKQEITQLVDRDGDGVADEYNAIAGGWNASANYHEFTFNLLHRDGFFYVSTSVPLKTGLTTYLEGSEPGFPVPYGPGSLLKVDAKKGTWEVFADGFRTPNGMTFGPDGDIYLCDNQGSWLPSSRLDRVVKGGFYGHQAGRTAARQAVPPVAWLPQNEIANSPSQPLFMPSGPYAGQILVGDVTHGGLNRIYLDRLDPAGSEVQGVVFQHTQGLEAGINRTILGPDGCLYVGGIGSNGNWNWNETKFGLQRLKPNGRTAFEILSVRARHDGFLVELTRPVPVDVLSDPAHYAIEQWRYEPTADYGGPKVDEEKLAVKSVTVGKDRQHAFIAIDGLKEGRVVHLRLLRFVDDRGSRMWATEGWYTLNKIPKDAGADFEALAGSPHRPEVAAPEAPANEALKPLFELWPLDTWKTVGEAQFKIEAGELVGTGSLKRNSFLMSPQVLKDFVLETDVWLQDGGNSGIQLRSHVNEQGIVYGCQIEVDSSARAWSGGLYDEGRRGWLQSLEGNAAARAAFKRGEWNHYRVECVGSRIRSFINGVPCADYEDAMDADGYLMFQVHSGDATIVKFRGARIAIR